MAHDSEEHQEKLAAAIGRMILSLDAGDDTIADLREVLNLLPEGRKLAAAWVNIIMRYHRKDGLLVNGELPFNMRQEISEVTAMILDGQGRN